MTCDTRRDTEGDVVLEGGAAGWVVGRGRGDAGTEFKSGGAMAVKSDYPIE
jgi:hypothetical protein